MMPAPESQTVKPTNPIAAQRISGNDTLRPSLNFAPSHSTTAVKRAATTMAANKSMRMILPSQANEIATINPNPMSNKVVGEWNLGLAIEPGVESHTTQEYKHSAAP